MPCFPLHRPDVTFRVVTGGFGVTLFVTRHVASEICHHRARLLWPNEAAMAVRAARQEQGRTLAELARALGTSWAAAQKLESPRANPTIKQLERTAASLGKRLVLSMA